LLPAAGAWGNALLPTAGAWSAAATALPAHGATALDDEDGNGGEGGGGIGPGDVEARVEGESGERDGGQIGAGGRLHGVGGEDVVAGDAGESALLAGKQRHDEESRDGDGDSEGTGLGLELVHKGKQRGGRHDGSEKEKKDTGSGVNPLVIELESGSESEDDERGREQFDKTIAAEGEQYGAVRAGSGDERNGTLDEHPSEGDGLEKDEAGAQWRRVGGEGHGNILTCLFS